MEAMRETFQNVTEASILLIDFMALLIVVYGTVEAVLRIVQAVSGHRRPGYYFIWLGYARWLVGALTFQLAADIVESALTPDWEDIGRLAAIAAIRTLLNFFLERDVAEVSKEQAAKAEGDLTRSEKG